MFIRARNRSPRLSTRRAVSSPILNHSRTHHGQKCEQGHVTVCAWYKLEICSEPPLNPRALARGHADGIRLRGLANEFLFSSARSSEFTAPHSDGVCGVGTARRLLDLPPIVGRCNLGSASGWTGQGRVHGGSVLRLGAEPAAAAPCRPRQPRRRAGVVCVVAKFAVGRIARGYGRRS